MESSGIRSREDVREPVALTILRSLLLREVDGEDREPITWKQFYSELSLVFGALISFALLVRILGG